MTIIPFLRADSPQLSRLCTTILRHVSSSDLYFWHSLHAQSRVLTGASYVLLPRNYPAQRRAQPHERRTVTASYSDGRGKGSGRARGLASRKFAGRRREQR